MTAGANASEVRCILLGTFSTYLHFNLKYLFTNFSYSNAIEIIIVRALLTIFVAVYILGLKARSDLHVYGSMRAAQGLA